MANLTEKLLQADFNEEKERGVYRSHRLAKLFNEKEPVEVEIKQLSARRQNDLSLYVVDDNGKMKTEKLFDMRLMVCMEGITSIDFRSKELQSHFKVKTPKDLCEKLFDTEINEIADAIFDLGSVKATEEDVENL